MDHSEAISKDAGDKLESASSLQSRDKPAESENTEQSREDTGSTRTAEGRTNNYERRKRKGNFKDHNMQHGGRGGGRDDNKRHKRGDLGRAEYFATNPDRRKRNEESQAKRLRDGNVGHGIQFSKEEIEAEERKPKRKVAVLIGYSGTGYKGMQISGTERTIEGDLFEAFIKAGAISKANAEDPKKSSLVRCARTDKGVHAAGNMISLKLIIEDPDIVQKINAELDPQIRVWGIERTIGGFSCYQACDSRWYEYLIPSYAFLPPHPSSWLAKQMEKHADEAGDREGYDSRQKEVKGFWEKVDEEEIQSILATFDEDIRWDVVKALQGEEEASAKAATADADVEQTEQVVKIAGKSADAENEVTEEAAIIINDPAMKDTEPTSSRDNASEESTTPIRKESAEAGGESANHEPEASRSNGKDEDTERIQRLRAATKKLRIAYTAARRRYRIPSERVERIQTALSKYVGTKNYHNYTIQKTYRDPSSLRHIKSFVINPKPILIGDGPDEAKTEWLSMKVHGQSFMMHQIRKMVGMVALMVRCGGNLDIMDESFTEERFSIPKVPGLGLLLERPVFDSYNTHNAAKFGKEPLEFGKYETELEAFKEREIYQRIFREEEERNEFGRFFNHIDNFKEAFFLFVTSKGTDATRGIERKQTAEEISSSSKR